MMSEKAWLDDYGGQTTEELIALAETHRTDSIVLAFEEAIEKKGADARSPEEVVVLAVEEMERQVNNGGFRQLFDSALHINQLVASVRAIGCERMTSIAERAIAALGIDGELTEDAMYDATDREDVQDALNALDDEYYATQPEEIVEEHLFAFIRENAARIRLP